MKIIQVCPRDYQSVGGVEHVVQKLSEGLTNKGHEVTIVCGNSKINSVNQTENNKIKIIRIPTYSPKNSFHIPKDKNTVKEALGKNVDIVHSHSAHSVISLIPSDIKNNAEVNWKLIYSMHFSTLGYSMITRFIWRLFWKNRVNNSLKQADAIHSTSLIETNLLTKLFSNSAGKISLIPLGLDDDVFHYTWDGKDSDYILYSGRLEKYKQVDLALQAVQRIREKGHNLKLYVKGSGSQADYFKKIAAKKDWVVYLAPSERKNYLELVSQARAVISLSTAENFGIFLGEACAIGTPIIATPEASAFCPKWANIKSLELSAIEQVILTEISNPGISIFPKECCPLTWKEVVSHFEDFYKNISENNNCANRPYSN
jgi:glycosyltransferase involved in cell wall biosynthesis